ncbi:LOW QUALITY PROTEIN: glutamate receptor ionotropic, kainate 2 [Drosophila busckii]|uniref:LOW QUALITY PROTEIN: glutamate receptor ionotropic, kainate 2 n=1 Tax=Drosophila busckii TaxID=30019 RepID=UPI0014332233|nr:LOW QUALITY PROTEIN: glutamate receptor ionotropic, kainate 2 [Drosophila busckii]
MATGLELLVAAALCAACPGFNDTLPDNLIRINEEGNMVTELPVDVEADMAGVTDDAPVETLETILNKKVKLRALREWINGQHLRIATLEDYPLSYTELLENGTRVGHGVSFQLINFLQEKFNFTYEVVVPQDNILGSTIDFDRSLVEMVNKSVSSLKLKLVAIIIIITIELFDWLSVACTPRGVRDVNGQRLKFLSCCAPLVLESWVWILIFVSLLAVGPIIYVLIILRNRLSGDGVQQPYSLGHCAWFVYGALMKQGSTLSPIADSTRLLFATWWIFITILTSFYTANLTAFLTLSKFTLPFNTVNDILTKNKHFVTMRGGGVEYAIRTTNESLYMLNPMIKNNYAVFSDATNDTYNLQNYVNLNGYVFVRDRPAINIMLYKDYLYRKSINLKDEKVHCPFALAKEPFLKKKRAFAYPIGSNLSELFDPELLNLVESGIIKHLSARQLPSADICPQDLGGTERQLRNGDLMMTYYIMLAGFATAFVVFTTELLFRYINGRHEANKWSRHGIGRATNGRSFKPSRWLRALGHIKGGEGQLLGTSTHANHVTPPPPYQSIFNQGGGEHLQRWRRNPGLVLPDEKNGAGVRRLINGRDYMVFRNADGHSQLVPIRSPSAALFQFTYTD